MSSAKEKADTEGDSLLRSVKKVEEAEGGKGVFIVGTLVSCFRITTNMLHSPLLQLYR